MRTTFYYPGTNFFSLVSSNFVFLRDKVSAELRQKQLARKPPLQPACSQLEVLCTLKHDLLRTISVPCRLFYETPGKVGRATFHKAIPSWLAALRRDELPVTGTASDKRPRNHCSFALKKAKIH